VGNERLITQIDELSTIKAEKDNESISINMNEGSCEKQGERHSKGQDLSTLNSANNENKCTTVTHLPDVQEWGEE
jgi:hypothetical protein